MDRSFLLGGFSNHLLMFSGNWDARHSQRPVLSEIRSEWGFSIIFSKNRSNCWVILTSSTSEQMPLFNQPSWHLVVATNGYDRFVVKFLRHRYARIMGSELSYHWRYILPRLLWHDLSFYPKFIQVSWCTVPIGSYKSVPGFLPFCCYSRCFVDHPAVFVRHLGWNASLVFEQTPNCSKLLALHSGWVSLKMEKLQGEIHGSFGHQKVRNGWFSTMGYNGMWQYVILRHTL